MNSRRLFTGALALLAIALIGSAGAVTYSLPDVAVAPAGSVDTILRLSTGSGQAAFNITITYDSSVVDPGTATLATDLTGFILAQNIIEAGANSELRMVVYDDPTTNFPANLNVLAVTVPWTVDAGASAGDATPLSVTDLGVSDDAGASIGGGYSTINGMISVANSVAPGAVTIDPDLNTVNVWNEFYPVSTFSFPADTTGLPTVSATNQTTLDSGGPTEREAGQMPLGVATTDNADDGFTGWNSNAWNIGYVNNSVYLVEWTFGGMLGANADQNDRLPDFRMRTVDGIGNTFVESVITGGQTSVFSLPGTGLTGAGNERTYWQFFEPSDLSGLTGGAFESRQGLIVEWDMVDFEDAGATGFDEIASGQVQLNNVTVLRFDRTAVDALFSDIPGSDVTDFTDASQFLLGLDFAVYGTGVAFPELGLSPAQNSYNANAYRRPMQSPTVVQSVSNVTFETELINTLSLDPGQVAWGYFREAGTPFSAATLNDETLVFRQVTSANIPITSDGTVQSSPRIRLRTTDQIGHSSEFFVMEVGTRNFEGVETSGRPPVSDASVATYHNYFAYPDGADLSEARNAGLDGIQGLIGILDFEADETDMASALLEGTIRFTELKLQSAPRSLFATP